MLNKIKILNAWQIKLILAFLMLLNHLHFVYGLLSSDVDNFFIIISRCVAPMFGYFLVEGVIHTKNLKKYVLRLWLWAIIVSLGNYLIGYIFTNAVSLSARREMFLTVGTNITFTIAISVTGLAIIHIYKKKDSFEKFIYFSLGIFVLLTGMLAEWGVILIPFMLITYLFKNKLIWKLIGYLILFIIAYIIDYEPLFILAIPFIFLYNGERGPNKPFNKYFFYIFYPVHLWLIVIINYFILK